MRKCDCVLYYYLHACVRVVMHKSMHARLYVFVYEASGHDYKRVCPFPFEIHIEISYLQSALPLLKLKRLVGTFRSNPFCVTILFFSCA